MGKPAARMGDMTVHGGSIVAGAPTVLIGGQPAARLTDMHVCPMVNPGVPPPPHVGGPIIGPGVPTVLICGMPAATVGDSATCAGPPDSIAPPGCPTVLIGPGGGGGAGAGSSGDSKTKAEKGDASDSSASGAGTSQSDTSSDDQPGHYLHVELQDQGGNPVFGVGYELDTADHEHSEGVAYGVIKSELTKSGDSTIALKAIKQIKWSQDDLHIGDTVQMLVETAGFVSGTPATIDLLLRDVNSGAKKVQSFEAKVQGDKISVDWKVEVPDDLIEKQKEAFEKGILVCPYYFFRVQLGGLTARSKMLPARDDIKIALKGYDENPLGDTKYELRASDGEVRSGKLDSNGEAEEKDVAAGLTLVSFSEIPDEDNSGGG